MDGWEGTAQPLIMPPKAKCSPVPPQKFPFPILQRPNQVTSLLSPLVPLCIPKRRMKSARSKSEGRNIKPSSPLSLTLLPSFLRDWGRKRRARAISPQKEDKNLPRMPRGNSNNRIRDSWRGHASLAASLRKGTHLGREEQHHGCENSRDSGSDSKFAMKRVERGEGSAWSDAPIF